jgi:hypothetical protein
MQPDAPSSTQSHIAIRFVIHSSSSAGQLETDVERVATGSFGDAPLFDVRSISGRSSQKSAHP